MSEDGSDLLSRIRADDLAAIKEHLAALPEVDFKHNNGAGEEPLTLAWIAAFVGARKCLAEAVRRGADLEFLANQATVRKLGLLNRNSLLGLLEGGMSPNKEELLVLFLSDFQNELPKSGTVEALDAIVREIGDLSVVSDSKKDLTRIRKSRAFHDAVPNLDQTLEYLRLMGGPEAKQLKAGLDKQLLELAGTLSQIIARSLALLSEHSVVFEETIKRHFRGYRKSRVWLAESAARARADLQARLAPLMDLYEDDEDLITWIDLALARLPIREMIMGAEAPVRPKRNDGLEFERRVARTLEEAGFHVEPTPASGDQGADVIATHNGLRFAIQCKDYVGQVGNAAVQEVLGAKAFYKADYAVVCSQAGFTKSAKSLAATSSVLLIAPESLPDLDKVRLLVE